MFVVIYQGYIKEGKEEEYKKAWNEVAAYFIERRGSLGSRLHRTNEGLWVAYSCWPDKATRDNSWPSDNAPSSELPDNVRKEIVTIKDSIDQERNEINQIRFETCMEVVNDLLNAESKIFQGKLSINQVGEDVADWTIEKNAQDAELIPNTPYKLYKNMKNTFEIIDAQLYAYNKKCVPATQEPESVDIHYVVKENDEIIAGICADVYTWKVMYIALLFVNEAYRNRDLATILLQRVENEAKAMGVTLAHTDTYDFQAKDFYLKQGYEIFGILDDCPRGHKRYYLKKILRK